MKARQHRKTVQRGMHHWINGNRSLPRYCMGIHLTDSFATLRRKYNQPQHAGIRSKFTLVEVLNLRKEMCDKGGPIMIFVNANLEGLRSLPFERFPYQDVVFDEQSDFIPLLQPRTTHYLKSLITKDHQ